MEEKIIVEFTQDEVKEIQELQQSDLYLFLLLVSVIIMET